MPVTLELSHWSAWASALIGISSSSAISACDCWNESPSSVITASRRGLSALKMRQNRPHASWAADVAGMAQR